MDEQAAPTFAQQLADLLTAEGEYLVGFTLCYTVIGEDGTALDCWEVQDGQSLMTTLGQVEWARLRVQHLVTDDSDEDDE